MKTHVTNKDFLLIKETFTDDEIKEKYGYLKVISQRDYEEMKKANKILEREVDLNG